MNFVDYLLEKSRERDALFIAGPTETITHRDLFRKVNALARHFGQTCGRGKRILVLAENSLYFSLCYLAAMKSGNTAVLVETRVAKDQLEKIGDLCEFACCCVQEKYRPKVRDGWPLFSEADCAALPVTDEEWVVETADDETAQILFTSGSTGEKKGVMISHWNLVTNSEAILEVMRLTEEDRACAVLPFTYCYGVSVLHTHLRVGGSVVLHTAIFLGTVISEIENYGCTGIYGVPSTYQILIHRTPFLKKALPTLRYMTCGGGYLEEKYVRMITDAFPEKDLFIYYGATEATARISVLDPALVLERMGSLGRGMPGVALEVLRPDGRPVDPGEIGEITVLSRTPMQGYFRDPVATAAKLKNGRLYTGDLGTVDEDGYVYFKGRGNTIIKSAGHRITPREVEDLINTLEAVSETAVVAVPDELMGEAAVAVVQPVGAPSGVLRDEIMRLCQSSLPSYKVPKVVVFAESMPLNASDKVDLVRLKAVVAAIRAGEEVGGYEEIGPNRGRGGAGDGTAL
ncbi:AMP-dependent synthetase [Methanofollis formosanus]|uniref:AMP-dependent synthetase n=1 Tax=Methanofollis formosanus TaxID=299308 RepID=A0A8G1A2N0_9EURY|nr:AMP-binding protein [Methanofollis formosanus]QYZ78957.1 AMP-dependent synthetase [Methanofollis formosanus]